MIPKGAKECNREFPARLCGNFPNMAVGGDAHIAPANKPDFTETIGEFDGTQWGDVGIAPYEHPREVSEIP